MRTAVVISVAVVYCLTVAVTVHALTEFTDDFDSYTTGSIIGQNSYNYGFGYTVHVAAVSSETSGIPTEPNGAEKDSGISGGPHSYAVWRSHDYALKGTEKSIGFQFSVRPTGNWTAASVLPNGLENSSIFGMANDGSSLAFRYTDAASTTTFGDAVTLNQWYDVRLVANFAANSGAGAATIYYRTNSAGGFVVDATIQNVNMNLSGPTHSATNWKRFAFSVATDGVGNTPTVDNLNLAFFVPYGTLFLLR